MRSGHAARQACVPPVGKEAPSGLPSRARFPGRETTLGQKTANGLTELSRAAPSRAQIGGGVPAPRYRLGEAGQATSPF